MTRNNRAVPVYTTSGILGALMKYPYLFNPQGEWIGWVTSNRQVYSVHGHYVGWLSKDPRVLRKRNIDHSTPARKPPQPPPHLRPPVTIPLPPLMPELPFNQVDVLDDEPNRLPTLDAGELREDMD
jgi:hypothetical protein